MVTNAAMRATWQAEIRSLRATASHAMQRAAKIRAGRDDQDLTASEAAEIAKQIQIARDADFGVNSRRMKIKQSLRIRHHRAKITSREGRAFGVNSVVSGGSPTLGKRR